MYFLARRWTANGLAASVAGMAFAFNGLTLNCLMWPNNIAALGWMPWVVVVVERACAGGGRRLALAVVVATMQMLTGAPEIIFLTWVIVGALWISQLAAKDTSRGRRLVRVVLIGATTLLMSAAQLLPFLDLLAHSQRDTSYGDSAWAMPVWGCANLFVPMFHCFRGFSGVYWQHEQYWTSSYYTSVGVFALALLAVFSVRRRMVVTLAILFVVSVVLAMGDEGFLYEPIRKILPQIGFMRFPIKFVVIVTFAVPLLAAFAMKARSEAPLSDLRSRLTMFGLWPIFLGVICSVIWSARLHPAKYEDWTLTWQNGLGRATFFVLFGATLAVLGFIKSPPARSLAGLVLLSEILGDSLNHVPPQNPTIARYAFEPGLLKLSPQPRLGGARVMVSPAANSRFRRFATSDPLKNYIASRQAQFANLNLIDGIPKLDGFYSLYLREADALHGALYSSTNAAPVPICDFLGVAHISDEKNLLEWASRSTAMPLITGGQKPLLVDDLTALNRITSANFRPQEVVFLASRPNPVITNQSDLSIPRSQFGAHSVSFEVQASDRGVVVIAQNFHRFWQATIDGALAPLLRANYAFQAVVVPGGHHTVQLRYVDRNFVVGISISLIAFGVCAVQLPRKKKRS